MEAKAYRSERMEQELRGKINATVNKRHGGAVPANVQDRIVTEERHIFGNGHGSLLAIAAKLAEFSESRGCPVGFRGFTGNLYLSHLLGLAAVVQILLTRNDVAVYLDQEHPNVYASADCGVTFR